MNAATYTLEAGLLADGASCVVFCDEVGRGALAGPVTVAACAITAATPAEHPPLADSKIVPVRHRSALAEAARDWAAHIALGWASAARIDTAGINGAVADATTDAIHELLEAGLRPDIIYSDGTTNFIDHSQLADVVRRSGTSTEDWDPRHVELRHQIRLDASSAACAAASIVAKVARDAHMAELAHTHPHWGFDRHAGYGTREHRDAILEHGTCSEHRQTFCARTLANAAQLTLGL